ncbi:ATP-binding protein [Streptomyces sp. NPDC059168]|uniref:ATP-binding protein n=1 Tax=Streptomyces sp. NPDC059168 TaxID=3346753 RepID=UPI00367EB63B
MDQISGEEGRRSPGTGPLAAAAVLGGGEQIAEARALARAFLADLTITHEVAVSERVLQVVQLVVSELVTNALKYAPGPCRLRMRVRDGAVEVTVWDDGPPLPTVRTPDPGRVGQHGLEIVVAACRSFETRQEARGKLVRAAVALDDAPAGGTDRRPGTRSDG